MKKYIGNRGTGKTYQLIQEARQNNGIVITVNESQAKALRLEYSDMKDRIYSFDDYMMTIILSGDIRNKQDCDQYELYIDDFDEVAAKYIPGKVMAGTINVEGNIFLCFQKEKCKEF